METRRWRAVWRAISIALAARVPGRMEGLARFKLRNSLDLSVGLPRQLCLAVVFGLIGMLGWIMLPKVSADSVTTLHPNPLQVTIVQGQVASVDIVVENIQNMYGAQVYLQFDPAVVEVVDADPNQTGVQVSAGNFLSPDFVQENQADNTLGKISYTITQLYPRAPVSGSGILFSVRFRGKAIGQQTLVSLLPAASTILPVVVAPQVTAPTPYQWQDGRITIAPFVPMIYYFPVILRNH